MNREAPPKLVKSAIRTIELFNVFAEARRPLSLGELAEGMKAPKSSCHELIQTLIHLGYVLAINEGRSYYPSRRLFDMAEQINSFNPIKERIQNELRQLRDRTGETVVIARLNGDNVVYAEVFEGTHTIRYNARTGDLKPIHASAVGKALAASVDGDSGEKLLAGLKLTHYNQNTITRRKELMDELATGRESGIHTSVGEQFPDVMGMASPVRIQGYLLAVGPVGPVERMEKNFAAYGEALLATARRIQD